MFMTVKEQMSLYQERESDVFQLEEKERKRKERKEGAEFGSIVSAEPNPLEGGCSFSFQSSISGCCASGPVIVFSGFFQTFPQIIQASQPGLELRLRSC